MFADELGKLKIGKKFRKIVKKVGKPALIIAAPTVGIPFATKKLLPKKIRKVVGAPARLIRKGVKRPGGVIIATSALSPAAIPLAARAVIRRKQKLKKEKAKKRKKLVIPAIGLPLRERFYAKQKKKRREALAKKLQAGLERQGMVASQAAAQAEAQAEAEVPMTPNEEQAAAMPPTPAEQASPAEVRQAAQTAFEEQGMSPEEAEAEAEKVAEGEAPIPEEVEQEVATQAGLGPIALLGIGAVVVAMLVFGSKKKKRRR